MSYHVSKILAKLVFPNVNGNPLGFICKNIYPRWGNTSHVEILVCTSWSLTLERHMIGWNDHTLRRHWQHGLGERWMGSTQLANFSRSINSSKTSIANKFIQKGPQILIDWMQWLKDIVIKFCYKDWVSSTKNPQL